jgi:hypothetical protein
MLGRSLEKEQLKQKASPLLQKRVLQVAEDEVVIDYACMARKAGIWIKALSLRGLRNTLLCRVYFCFAAILPLATNFAAISLRWWIFVLQLFWKCLPLSCN